MLLILPLCQVWLCQVHAALVGQRGGNHIPYLQAPFLFMQQAVGLLFNKGTWLTSVPLAVYQDPSSCVAWCYSVPAASPSEWQPCLLPAYQLLRTIWQHPQTYSVLSPPSSRLMKMTLGSIVVNIKLQGTSHNWLPAELCTAEYTQRGQESSKFSTCFFFVHLCSLYLSSWAIWILMQIMSKPCFKSTYNVKIWGNKKHICTVHLNLVTNAPEPNGCHFCWGDNSRFTMS